MNPAPENNSRKGVIHRGSSPRSLMRWLVVLLLLTAIPLMPMVLANHTTESREEQLVTIVGPNEVVVHQNETVSTYITLHNKASENQAFTVEPLTIPQDLEVIGLPLTELLVPNHLRQMTFSIKANATAAFTSHNISFRVTSDLMTDSETVDMRVLIAPYSNLNYGVDAFASLTVDEKVRTSVAVNISNNASLEDNVTFSVYSSSGWNWGWDMQNTVGDHAYEIMQPGQLKYVYFWIDVPAIENGMPLADTGPRFILSATSSLDKAVKQWNVDLLMNAKRNASIDSVESSLTVAPNQDGRLSVVVRNVGNTPNTLNITLQGVDTNGNPLPNTPAADRFNTSGWVVALFGGLEDIVLQPNESRTVEIGFQAPNAFTGSINVQIKVFASGASSLMRVATVKADILRLTQAELSYTETDCDIIAPNQSCSAFFSVKNSGNSYNTFMLRVGDITDGFEAVLPQQSLLVQPGQTKMYAPATITARSDAVAFMTGTVTVELLGDDGGVLHGVTVPLKVAPEIKWTFRNVEEQVDAKGRLSIAMEARNDGNAVDGLIVQLRSTHSVDMGFIPPEGAVFDNTTTSPRSFEIDDVPLNSNFTIRAWVQLPQDQISNGSVYINTTIRSRYAPELSFTHTTTGEYLGIEWQPQPNIDEGLDWRGMASTAVLYVKAWSGVLFATLFAGVVIYKAVIDRNRRLDQESVLPYQEQSADDWLQQYQKEPQVETTQTPREPLAPVPKATYEAMFRHEHGQASLPRAPVNTGLVHAASIVLDQRTEDITKAKADDLLTSIANKPVTASNPQPQHETASVPLPEVKDQPSPTRAVDDLEF